MNEPFRLADVFDQERLDDASVEASRRRLFPVVGWTVPDEQLRNLRIAFGALELQLHQLLDDGGEDLTAVAVEAFHIGRTLPAPSHPRAHSRWLLKLSCIGILGDRSADVRRLLNDTTLLDPDDRITDWSEVVEASTHTLWLRIFRKRGWDDLDKVQSGILRLRELQKSREPEAMYAATEEATPATAWRLILHYHHARAAELLGLFSSQGEVDGRFDIRQQVEAQFDRALTAASRGQLLEEEGLSRLLAGTAQRLISASIWTVTRAVNSRVTRFVETLISRDRPAPIFDMLPPQRKTLREDGLLGSGHRSVVVSLPTSSGKTFIAQFRILQALNQFDAERGWVAYVVPTRALVNQITVRLRRDFGPLGVVVEKVSPALEVDGIEASLLTDEAEHRQFRVLIVTPEKLDLMIRGGWEARIGRPLTLVVVDEAHGIGSSRRGLKLELLLATINRECRNAQFLLLTPFIRNAAEVASWLSPDSNKDVELSVDWSPNDRAIAIGHRVKGEKRGDYSIELATKSLSATLSVPEVLSFSEVRPLGYSWSEAGGQGRLAAAIAQSIKSRGPVIVLAQRPGWTWGIAEALKIDQNLKAELSARAQLVRDYLIAEMGEAFPLVDLLRYGIGMHHSGLPDDVRYLTEWLVESGDVDVLIATTTIAQGVNFPVTGVVLASHQYPYGEDMPPQDFWNLAGRAGRVDQGDFGLVVLAAPTQEKARILERFLAVQVSNLNSTLLDMVREVAHTGRLLSLESLSYEPRWSAFLQYLAHSYRLIGDHEEFAAEAEQVLRGTLGFQALRRSSPGWADELLQGVFNYAERLEGKPLALVDGTGFSWESVSATLARLSSERIGKDVWAESVLSPGNDALRKLMGILLSVPELREQLQEATGGQQPDGSKLAHMILDWVNGATLREMSIKHFGSDDTGGIEKCCKSVFGRLSQTAAWGLSALQVLTLGDIEELSEDEQRRLRNIPAKVYYGVGSDEAVLLRMAGVPRAAAQPLSLAIGLGPTEDLVGAREKLRGAGGDVWKRALGDAGDTYRRVWQVLEGEAVE